MRFFITIYFFLLINSLLADNLIRGGGLNYCGYLIKTVSQHSQYSGMWKQWITGFISGYNFSSKNQYLISLEDDEIFYAVKKRCEERPKDKVSEATLWIISNN